MRRRYVVTVLAAVLAAGIASARDEGSSPGLWGGVSYLDVGELEAEIARRDEDVARAGARIEELEKKVTALEDEIAVLEAERADQASEARQAIILHDRMARGGMLRLVLGAESLTDVAVFSQLHARILARESETFETLSAQEDALKKKKSQLEQDRDLLQKLKSDLLEHRRALEKRRKTLNAIR